MVTMPDRPLGPVRRIPPLPPFASGAEILADELVLLDPPSSVSVTDAAERGIRVPVAGVWEAFDRKVAPYMVEPSDISQSRKFTAGIFVGPSQSGKSQMLLNTALHAPLHNPGPVQVIHMTKRDADAWVEEKLDPAIQNSPLVLERLGRAASDNTFSRKRFRGMRLTIGYPTATQLSSRTQRMVLLSDYDHMPATLGHKDRPEGTPFGMARRRVLTYMSQGFVLAESSPAYPQADASWKPDPTAPHMLPPATGGIVTLYNEGTRGRWYWACPDCGDDFEPTFARLRYDETLEPGAAGASAEMECPSCGSLIAHRRKIELNRAALNGRGGWLHEASDGSLCRIDDPRLRETSVASYALNGAAAAFSNWRDMVAAYETARRAAEAMGDETGLAEVTYTQIGLPYCPRRLIDGSEIDVQFLRDHASGGERGVCPAWTRFVTVTVDVQQTRFPVLVTAWGADGERAVIDRFELAKPPPDAPRAADRALDPARYVEDWQVLVPLADRVWPVAGAGYGLRALAVAVDFQGAPGVSDRAEQFWRSRRTAGDGRRWFLSRGWGGRKVRGRVWYAAPEQASKGKKARSIRLLNMAVDALKDSVDAALRRTEDGAGRLHLPAWLAEDQLAEFAAEVRGKAGWEKRPGVLRNEGFDLAVQALALAEHFGARRIDWTQPPAWARLGPDNSFAVRIDTEPSGEAPADAPVAPSQPAPRRPRVTRIGYLGGP